jgi:hypothetical protein
VPVPAVCHFSKIKKAIHQKPAFSGKISDSPLLHIKKDSVKRDMGRDITEIWKMRLEEMPMN